MKQILVILLGFFFSQTFGQSFECKSDSQIVKRYRLKTVVSFENVVKITYNNKYSFYIEGSSYINNMSETFTFLNEYKDFNDTIFIKIDLLQNLNGNDTSFMTIQKSTDIINVKQYFNNDSIKSAFSIFAFYYNSFFYILNKPLKKRNLLIYNEQTKQFEKKLIKEKFSYYCAELTAGAGWKWKIKDTNFVIFVLLKWIS